MDKRIFIGGIVGLVTATSIYVWESKIFSKTQKTILLICIIFPPLQWLGIIIFSVYYHIQYEKSPEGIIDATEKNLMDLKSKGILSVDEFTQKIEKTQTDKREYQLKNSQEYKQLKNLFDNGVLTKEEFDNKTDLIRLSLSKTIPHSYCKINNILYKIDDLESEINSGNLRVWLNTIVELEDGRKNILEYIPELSHLLEIIKKNRQ